MSARFMCGYYLVTGVLVAGLSTATIIVNGGLQGPLIDDMSNIANNPAFDATKMLASFIEGYSGGTMCMDGREADQ